MKQVPSPGSWTDWVPLTGVGRNKDVPALPGIYRVRVQGDAEPVYIGQTGNSLRGRLAMLYGTYGDEMPYRDPHTAACALWAHRDATGEEYEVSAMPVPSSDTERKGWELAVIHQHRLQHGGSPRFNFGG